MATVQGPIPASFKASMRHELANSISSSQSALHFSQDLERQFVSHHKSEPNAPGPVSNTQDTNLLVVSPYTAREHLLDLRPLQTNQQLLAKALTTLLPVTEQYATASYQSSFNWATVVDTLRVLAQEASFQWADQSFYIVVFRSQIPPTTDRGHLAELDRVSHMEATKSGGLLKYWFGVPDADGRNLATCTQIPFSSILDTILVRLGGTRTNLCELNQASGATTRTPDRPARAKVTKTPRGRPSACTKSGISNACDWSSEEVNRAASATGQLSPGKIESKMSYTCSSESRTRREKEEKDRSFEKKKSKRCTA